MLLIGVGIALPSFAEAQSGTGIPQAITTPDKVESRIGTLEFKDGAPSAATVEKAFDTLNFTHALDAYLNSYGGASAYAIRQGFLSVGANDNSVLIFFRSDGRKFAISDG
jgi:hypothetical protein